MYLRYKIVNSEARAINIVADPQTALISKDRMSLQKLPKTPALGENA